MKNILEILEAVNIAVNAMLWEDDAEHMRCRDNDFPGL